MSKKLNLFLDGLRELMGVRAASDNNRELWESGQHQVTIGELWESGQHQIAIAREQWESGQHQITIGSCGSQVSFRYQ